MPAETLIQAVAGSTTPDPGGVRATGVTATGLTGELLMWSGAEWLSAAGQALLSTGRNLTALTAPGLLSGVVYDTNNRATSWTIDNVTYTAVYTSSGVTVAGSDGTVTSIGVDPAQRITSVDIA